MSLVMFIPVVPSLSLVDIISAGYSLSATWLLCLLNDSEVSRWTPKIFGHCTRGSCKSSMSIFRWVLAWCLSAVNNVTDDFVSGTQLSPQNSCLGYPPYPES